MTAVLSATDALRADRHMSMDDISYSTSAAAEWRAKYDEVADMLAETKAELDDFHHASKELEAELEAELQRTEKAQQDLRVKVARAESEREEWKSKFMSLQTTHNSTTTSLQRELDKLRQEHQQTKIQLRELEMGNDDLERNERAVSSSLADIEAKYSRALEEKILLEHELLDKANLEEQCQRLRDELRDTAVEVSVLKDQLAARASFADSASSIPVSSLSNHSTSSLDDLLKTPPPADLSLSELGPSTESLPESLPSDDDLTPRKRITMRQGGQSIVLQHAVFNSPKPSMSTPPNSTGIPRSSTLPLLYNSPRTRTPITRNPSTVSTTSNSSVTSKSRGVQMVTEMRARVRNLEQKIHTRVPRLRMGSIAGRPNNSNAVSTPNTGAPSSLGKSTVSKPSWENALLASRRSVDSQKRSNGLPEKKDSSGDSTGWVLIMEDSPSPPRRKERERRRASSPLGNATFRPTQSTASPSPTLSSKPNPFAQSTAHTGIRRPQSRLSSGSTATSSSITSSSSRPSTPTFLPIPAAGLTSLKRSTGPGLAKRSSLGSSTAAMPPPSEIPRERPTTLPPLPRISSGASETSAKALPRVPLYNNITIRQKMPTSTTSSSLLSKSRIGRPSSGGSRRNSEATEHPFPDMAVGSRPRSGSSSATGGS
ncbi:hypothetical protein C8J56DRAFT_919357 [Mycena floridula]|nr:hypothetical protein C8J56DRAFT_919357 [Mycena floridula]